jgi:hypothetical protein
MAMVCPQCGKTYEHKLVCQLCDVRLVFHDLRRLPGRLAGPVMRWRQTPWGRIIIGVFLAQGLFYALRQLLTGALLALHTDGTPQQVWTSPTGSVVLQGLCLGTLFLGALLAGSSQGAGMFLGAVVGVWNGMLWTVLHHTGSRHPLSFLALLSQPILQTAVGFLAGWFGSVIWRPIPVLDPLARTKAKRTFASTVPFFAGPIAWFRVTMGILIAVGGALGAAKLYDLAMDAADGILASADEFQDHIVIWEIKALALFCGGLFAGANKRNGFKQGVIVGLGTAVLLIGAQIPRYPNWWQAMPFVIISSLTLPVVGGWFGGQLLPPVVPVPRKSAALPTP